MSTGVSFASFDPSTLLSYYQSKMPQAPSLASSHASARKSATAADAPPWEATAAPKESRDADVMATTNFLDTSKVPLSKGSTVDAETEQDNQKLFALYTAVNNLSYLASMSKRDGMTAGQLGGFNTRFQDGLRQVRDYIANTTFNNFTLQASAPASSVTSAAGTAFGSFTYKTRTLAGDDKASSPLPGLNASQSFAITVKKGGVATDVAIDLSQVGGGLTLDNVIAYVNQQLSAQGFASRFHRSLTKGSIDDPENASYGIEVAPAGTESLSFKSDASAPALYVAGNSGVTTATDDTKADQQGRLIKLTDLAGSQTGAFSATANPTSGLTTAQATVVDSSGNVYVVGNATGDFGNQINQGSQDTYLTKYDSAGNVQWTQLLGSAGTASAYSLALDPTGGVVVAGSTTGTVMQGAVADGNADSFVAKYDATGNQTWAKQIQTLANNQAASVSVDATGNVYIGGQVKGVIGKGQSNNGGLDAYVAKLDNKGKTVYEQQYGTSGTDSAAATATTSDGGLVVASVVNGHAIVSKYANGDATQPPLWSQDLGALQAGGTIGGMTVANGKIYLTGTTTNPSLTAGGAATVAHAGSGGMDAYVFSLGGDGTPGTVTYVGTGAGDKGNAVTVGSDGTVYLAGTTGGTFAGQSRNVPNVDNLFVSALNTDGTIQWTRQYGGADGTSTGQGIAFDASGSSVLDALGLPRGQMSFNQTVDLTQSTTLRAGDSFQIKLAGAATRTAKITIEKGETLTSLVRKINIEMQNAGKASVSYGSGNETLKIAVNSGVTASLIAGPDTTDALARLGLSPQTLTSTDDKNTTNASTAYGLGLPKSADISTSSGGGAARAQLLSVLTAIQKIYQSENKPASIPSVGNASGTVSPQVTSRLANYSLALDMLSGSSSSSSASSLF
ncbi:MAG: hypothetical protein JOZ72_15670 [Alphaproteobacteria bacterium]|nr:hypothetical protein [Alphaproteobacteria bacterium]